MAWIRTVGDGEARGPLAEQYARARARAGRVFSIVRAMSLAPRTLARSFALYEEVVRAPGPLSRRQRELLAVVTSRANGCHY